MVKNNNPVVSAKFKKHLFEYGVRCNFNQPAKRKARKLARLQKAVQVFPRPTQLFRPIVQCARLRSNRRQRYGRGFTIEELKGAGLLPVAFARSIGIAVDLRRKNKSEESLQRNVQRLQEYKSKLILFPRHAGKPKKGPVLPDTTSEEVLKSAQQIRGAVLPITKKPIVAERREITEEQRKKKAHVILRRAHKEAHQVGYYVKKKQAEKDQTVVKKKK